MLILTVGYIEYRLSSLQHPKTQFVHLSSVTLRLIIICVSHLLVPPEFLLFLEHAQCYLSSLLLLILFLPSKMTSLPILCQTTIHSSGTVWKVLSAIYSWPKLEPHAFPLNKERSKSRTLPGV